MVQRTGQRMGPRMGRGGDRGRRSEGPTDYAEAEFQDRVVKVNRCAKVMKGGRRFSFSALVVYGNKRGSVAYGFGKAREAQLAVEKAIHRARRAKRQFSIRDARTISHRVEGRFGAARVLLMPAPPGTGIIAGAAVRAVAELCGIKDLFSKSMGSTNPINLVKAAFDALSRIRTREQVEALRGVRLEELDLDRRRS